MWLFTTQGFYSVVAHRDEPSKVLVRTRSREDLDALRQQIAGLELIEDPSADYRYRAVVEREEWEVAASALVAAIDYPNFKSAVAERQGSRRAGFYGEVWRVMRELQDDSD